MGSSSSPAPPPQHWGVPFNVGLSQPDPTGFLPNTLFPTQTHSATASTLALQGLSKTKITPPVHKQRGQDTINTGKTQRHPSNKLNTVMFFQHLLFSKANPRVHRGTMELTHSPLRRGHVPPASEQSSPRRGAEADCGAPQGISPRTTRLLPHNKTLRLHLQASPRKAKRFYQSQQHPREEMGRCSCSQHPQPQGQPGGCCCCRECRMRDAGQGVQEQGSFLG